MLRLAKMVFSQQLNFSINWGTKFIAERPKAGKNCMAIEQQRKFNSTNLCLLNQFQDLHPFPLKPITSEIVW